MEAIVVFKVYLILHSVWSNQWGAAQSIALTDRLYRQIGQLQVEVDWLKKKTGQSD